jgi:hypothetical protein
MATNDSSSYEIRFNEITRVLEFKVGNLNWVQVPGGASGITQLTGDITAGPGSGSQVTTLSPTAVKSVTGVTDGSNAAAGQVGEYKEVLFAGVSAGSSNVTAALASLPLTAGDWDVTGVLLLLRSGSVLATTSNPVVGISTTSGGFDVFGSNALQYVPIQGTSDNAGISIPSWRLNIASPATVFINAQVSFSGATPAWDGRISARRMR